MPCLNSQKKGKGLGHASVSFLKKLGSWFQPWKVCSSLGIIIPARARAVEMHINMSQEPLSAEIYRKNEARRNIEALEHWFKATSVWRNIDPRCSKNQVLYISGPWMAMLNHPWGKKIGQKMEKRERKIDEVSVSFSVFLLNLKQKLHPKTCLLLCACGCVGTSHHIASADWYDKVTCPHEHQVPDNPSKQGFRVPFDLRPQSITHYQCQFVAFLSEDTAAPRIRKRSGRGKDTTTRQNTNKDNEPWDKTNEI